MTQIIALVQFGKNRSLLDQQLAENDKVSEESKKEKSLEGIDGGV